MMLDNKVKRGACVGVFVLTPTISDDAQGVELFDITARVDFDIFNCVVDVVVLNAGVVVVRIATLVEHTDKLREETDIVFAASSDVVHEDVVWVDSEEELLCLVEHPQLAVLDWRLLWIDDE